MKWKIFYADGSTFCDEQGKPFDAPKWGAQVIIYEDAEHGRNTALYFDYYIYYKDYGWVGCFGHDALVDHVANAVDRIEAVIIGRMLPFKRYDEIKNAAMRDEYLPTTTARRKGEYPGDFGK